jgi:hypothetical protein
MDVLAWNMQHNEKNWRLLRDGAELEADVHVLCEATKPPRGVNAIGQWRTVGLDDDLPLDRKRTDRPWSTAVAARSGPTYITDARSARGYELPALLPFKPSRPGSWTAASVEAGGTALTVIALYGLMDEKSDASVHRSLSEVAPIFDHPVYGKHVLLGGDFNIVANPRPDDSMRERHRTVLTRLEAYGLVNCVDRAERSATDPSFDDCPCGERPCTQHKRTFQREGAAAYQEDYLFASGRLLERLVGCTVLPFQPTSDHTPIRTSFEL